MANLLAVQDSHLLLESLLQLGHLLHRVGRSSGVEVGWKLYLILSLEGRLSFLLTANSRGIDVLELEAGTFESWTGAAPWGVVALLGVYNKVTVLASLSFLFLIL